MSVKFCTYPSKLKTAVQNQYRAQVVGAESIDEQGLVKEIMKRGSTVREADVAAIFVLLKEVIFDSIKSGNSFNLPWLVAKFSISGKFFGPKDGFVKGRNKVQLNLVKSPFLRKAVEGMTPEMTLPTQPNLLIQEVGIVNGVLEVVGHNLKIDGDDASVGLWIIAKDGTETKIEGLYENMPSRIAVTAHNLAPGEYKVKVVTQYVRGHVVQEPREFVFKKPFVV